MDLHRSSPFGRTSSGAVISLSLSIYIILQTTPQTNQTLEGVAKGKGGSIVEVKANVIPTITHSRSLTYSFHMNSNKPVIVISDDEEEEKDSSPFIPPIVDLDPSSAEQLEKEKDPILDFFRNGYGSFRSSSPSEAAEIEYAKENLSSKQLHILDTVLNGYSVFFTGR